jgi:ribose 5-phosphate isomerase B
MRVAIGADHGGFPLKAELTDYVRELGHDPHDVGAHQVDPLDDYPDFAIAVANAVTGPDAERGIMICGSGVGAAITANKVRGARASVCHDTYSAHQGVEHDQMNVLCLGARIVGGELAREIVKAFLSATFIPEEQYIRRLNKIKALDGDPTRDPNAN